MKDTWIGLAACKGRGKTFFQGARSTWTAKKICAQCPVQEICLWYVLANEDPFKRYGVYGGMTPEEREDMARADGVTRDAALDFYDILSEAWDKENYA